ncbi:uncharacterized protein OCT59_026262 [Rhizophagus irregularis]|uniref:uncharacterized protein n=1 Tax=Rhizophagus irregularis TaxID=588596 RepID=UPI00331961C2|nr:hypothetical protein OCT59_026262 [Rhizophagus irregularis]
MESIDDFSWNSEVRIEPIRYWNSEVLDRTYQRYWNSEFRMEPIKDIGIRRFQMEHQRYWNSEMEPIEDIGIRRFWMEPIDDFEIRRFRMEPIDDFWNSEILDTEERFQTFILKVLNAKVRLRTFISKVLDAKIKEAETEFRVPISKVKEAERTSISKDYGIPDALWAPFRRSKTPKVHVSDLISKVSGSPEFSWTEFRRFSALWFQPGRNFQHGYPVATWIGWDFEDPGCCRTFISKVKEAERQVPDSHIKGPGFPFKELQKSQTAGLDISKLLASKFFFVCRYPLFVGIEPTGTISKLLTTCKCAVKR